ncbi:segregation and condensation protein A [Nakamurella sp. UYEF19]|uniref:segregation and condensation protein A n=1 Tax=Nakamurella sp. UYEF19 TaxID=1756392 RepID=UPI0033922C66
MTARAGVITPAAASPDSPSTPELVGARPSFHVHLANFEGPFDLLLQLIGQHRMDVTEVALHTVTDDFIRHIRTMGKDVDLGVVTEFLVVAATLLDLKAARLLPDGEVEDNADIDLLEARDLLFARLLAYRAYQQVTVLFQELEAAALRRFPRAVTLEDRYLGLLPEVQIGMDAARFAEMAAGVFLPKPPPPSVSLDHIHSSPVSVALHTAAIRELLAARGQATFGELIAGCTQTMEVVARFLGLLNLYREAAVAFDQPEPLGLLMVRWTGDVPDPAGVIVDEEYE